MLLILSPTVIKVGFQYPKYYTSVSDGLVEVCLVLIECPHYISIYRPFQLKVYSVDGTAIGKAAQCRYS